MASKVSDIKDGKSEEGNESRGNVTQDTFLQACNEIASENEKVAAANEARKRVRKKWKAEGIELGVLDETLAEADWGRNEIREKEETRRKYRLWLNLPAGTQPDLFQQVDTSDPKKAAQEWSDKGVTAGLRALERKPPEECPAEHHQDFLTGYDTGQRRLVEANPKLNGAMAKAGAKTPEPA